MKTDQAFWSKMLAFYLKNPVKFEPLQKFYQIKKLQLQKFTAVNLLQKIEQLNVRRAKNIQESSKMWMENQFRVFIWLVFVYGNYLKIRPQEFAEETWAFLAQIFEKDPIVCKYFYYCLIKNDKLNWQLEEDQEITKMMNTSQAQKKWTVIGLQLFRKSEGQWIRKPKAVRQRWISHLNPEINRSQWTPQQDLAMLKQVQETGKSWSKIAKMIVSRSQHTIKNRYNKIIIRKIKKQNKEYCFSLEQKILEKHINELEGKVLSFQTKNQNQKNQTNFHQENEKAQKPQLNFRQYIQKVKENCPTIVFQPIILSFGGFSI